MSSQVGALYITPLRKGGIRARSPPVTVDLRIDLAELEIVIFDIAGVSFGTEAGQIVSIVEPSELDAGRIENESIPLVDLSVQLGTRERTPRRQLDSTTHPGGCRTSVPHKIQDARVGKIPHTPLLVGALYITPPTQSLREEDTRQEEKTVGLASGVLRLESSSSPEPSSFLEKVGGFSPLVLLVDTAAGIKGAYAESVRGVVKMSLDQIEPLPEFLKSRMQTDCIWGVGKLEQELVILLDLDRYLSDE